MVPFMKKRSKTVTEIIVSLGSLSEVARRLGVSRQAIAQWDKVPVKHLRVISEMTGIPCQKLRPDLYEKA
jgi:DNA-binding transcriptional regulator YdaS (Cro superfamily)